jgi:hypothetical protein
MTPTLYVLLAAGALGAPGDGACSCNATSGACVQTAPAPSSGVIGWLHNLFGPKQPSITYVNRPVAQPNRAEPAVAIQRTTYAPPPASVSMTSQQLIQPAPNTAPAATGVTQATTVNTPQANLELTSLTVAKKYEDRIGHEKDYSWVTGHLFYIHTDGGRWVVRYGLPDEIDRFGGSVVLAPGVEMRNYREGDLVCVYGDVLDEGRASRSLGGALYRVNAISLVDRADP